jgi:BirA family biotin operon repressor/biotin-[acetyl-CoA-carboxylase] ligase
LAIGHSFVELESVDSTNNYAMALANSGKAKHGTLFFAHHQWAGKGQRGRTWDSQPGENIILSVVLEPVAFPPSAAFGLSATVALACHDFFSRHATDGVTIKWPNDLYWNDRKAGGILIENQFKGSEWLLAVAGMGININQVEFDVTASRLVSTSGHPASAALRPVSLRQITGRTFDVPALARELGECLDHRYAQWEAGGFNRLMEDYNHVLYRRGKEVQLRKDNAVFRTTIEGVSPQGELLTSDVMRRQFQFGEVEWVI